MSEVSVRKSIWRGFRYSARTVWMLFIALSLIINIALGITNFILQPIWRAAAVTTATSVVKAKAEIQERKAVAKTKAKEQAEARAQRSAAVASAVAAANAQAKANTKLVVANVRAKEKAKGRIRRVAVAVPMIGVAIAGGFEYANYTEWQSENPDGDFQQYGKETLEISKQVVDEVLQELPEEIRPSREKLLSTYIWLTGAEERAPEIDGSEQDVSTIDRWIEWVWGGQEEPAPVDPRTLANP